MKPYDLNLGYPELAAIPKDTLAGIANELLCNSQGLQYGGDLKGVTFAREEVARFLSDQTGDPLDVANLMLTTGSVHGIDVVCRSLTQPGDVVIVERPSFFFAINVLRMSHVELVSVPLCADGIDMDGLQSLIERCGSRLRLLYTIPSYQNPTGLCATADNRQKLVALAQQHNFVVLEDSAYQFLHFDTPAPPMLRHYAHDSDHVVTVGTFSKLLAPSLRQGWIWATPEQIDLFTRYKSDASASLLTCELLTEYLRRGLIQGQINYLRGFYREKARRMIDAMHKYLPTWVSWTIPAGGYFVWLTLPEACTASQLRTVVQARGADFMPGQTCFIEPTADRYIRLCFAYVNADALETGIAILGESLANQV